VTTPDGPQAVLITGASSGIGRAAAHQLAAEGTPLVLASRSAETLERARQECVGRGSPSVLVVPTDVADGKAVDSLFDRAREEHGGLRGVIHAAAVLAYGRFPDVPAEVFDQVQVTNVLGTANVARSALRLFEDQGGGSLVVVGSVLGKMATPYLSSYATGKWAVQGLVRTLQIEARSTPGVRVSLVSPGGINTPIYDLAGSYVGHPGHPPPPVYQPETVARALVDALDHDRRDRDVGFGNKLMVFGFRALPGVYDLLVGPMMRVLGLGRDDVEPHTGNVFEPRPDGEAVRGRWPRLWG
jgi:NAD(P)-dependent dehydrogenase (short-subunit alcohol dehydrogenase family)